MDICLICLNDLNVDSYCYLNYCQCQVKYHYDCLLNTLIIFKKCPICLKNIISNNYEDSINNIYDDFVLINKQHINSKKDCIIS